MFNSKAPYQCQSQTEYNNKAIISGFTELSAELKACSCPSIGNYFSNESGNSSFTVPKGVSTVRIMLSGGGSGGNGIVGGGGSGGFLDTFLQVKEDDIIKYTIGRGGDGGGTGGSGDTGGNSSITVSGNTLMVGGGAGGGAGGSNGGAGGSPNGVSGSSATSSSGDLGGSTLFVFPSINVEYPSYNGAGGFGGEGDEHVGGEGGNGFILITWGDI
jgi:hypothetical protein